MCWINDKTWEQVDDDRNNGCVRISNTGTIVGSNPDGAKCEAIQEILFANGHLVYSIILCV